MGSSSRPAVGRVDRSPGGVSSPADASAATALASARHAEPDPIRTAAVPVRADRPLQAVGRALRRRAGRPVDRHAVRPSCPASVIAALGLRRRTWVPAESSAASTLRSAVSGWIDRRFGIDVSGRPRRRLHRHQGVRRHAASVAALRRPDRDTILYPAIAYPTYEMGAILAGCRPVPVPLPTTGRLELDAIDPADAGRALALWVNSPGNPTGAIDDLGAAAAWGRAHDVPVFSDECYVEFTWHRPRPHDPRARPRRRGRRALVVEALEPGRCPGRFLRRRPRPGGVPPARFASTSA